MKGNTNITIPPSPDQFQKYRSTNEPCANSISRLQVWTYELVLKHKHTRQNQETFVLKAFTKWKVFGGESAAAVKMQSRHSEKRQRATK